MAEPEDDEDYDETLVQELRSQIKALREVNAARKESEKQRWEKVHSLLSEVLIVVEGRIQALSRA